MLRALILAVALVLSGCSLAPSKPAEAVAAPAPAKKYFAVAQGGPGTKLSLATVPCESPKALSFVPDPVKQDAQDADLVLEGKPMKACWVLLPNGTVGVASEEGHLFTVPVEAFEILSLAKFPNRMLI